MAVFFCLSGFLITSTLLYWPNVREFLIRRLCRIVPLSWAYMIVVLTVTHAGWKTLVAQLLFRANYPPFSLTKLTGHLWSLCVEVHFYLTVALLFALLRRRGLLLLPVLCLIVTGLRIATHTPISIVTHLRVDEILAGACLALAVESERFGRVKVWLQQAWLPWVLIPVAYASASESSGALEYLRPYIVTLMVGQTVFWGAGATRATAALEDAGIPGGDLLCPLRAAHAGAGRLDRERAEAAEVCEATPGGDRDLCRRDALNAILRALVDCAGQALVEALRGTRTAAGALGLGLVRFSFRLGFADRTDGLRETSASH